MKQEDIGKFITKKRKDLNITQEQLAEKLDVSNKTILKWENGKCLPNYPTIKMLCNELGVTLTELMYGEEQEENSIRLCDEDLIIDLLKQIKELKKEKNHLKSLICICISVSLLIFGIFCNGSVTANVISIIVFVIAVGVDFVGLSYIFKNIVK